MLFLEAQADAELKMEDGHRLIFFYRSACSCQCYVKAEGFFFPPLTIIFGIIETTHFTFNVVIPSRSVAVRTKQHITKYFLSVK